MCLRATAIWQNKYAYKCATQSAHLFLHRHVHISHYFDFRNTFRFASFLLLSKNEVKRITLQFIGIFPVAIVAVVVLVCLCVCILLFFYISYAHYVVMSFVCQHCLHWEWYCYSFLRAQIFWLFFLLFLYCWCVPHAIIITSHQPKITMQHTHTKMWM